MVIIMNGNRIIVHTLIKIKGKYLITKRSKEETSYPEYWDIPGGLVELGELPRDAAIRETKEEVGLNIKPTIVIHEDSNYDRKKDMIFIRLVYICKLLDNNFDIILDKNEHSEYRLIDNLNDIKDEKISPFLYQLFEDELKLLD